MDLEKTIYISSLYNIYGELLTKKQQQIFEDYVFNNLSLGEISENFNITRQAVLDSFNKSCVILNKYEESLHILKNNNEIKNLLEIIIKNEKDVKLITQINRILKNL